MDNDKVLVVAGGQDAELYLALYAYMAKTLPASSTSSLFTATDNTESGKNGSTQSEQLWELHISLRGSINNSVTLYWPPLPSTSPTSSDAYSESKPSRPAACPRLVVSNNDCTVKFFDISLSKAQNYRTSSAKASARVSGSRARVQRRAPQDRDAGSRNAVAIHALNGDILSPSGFPNGQPLEMVGMLKMSVPVNHSKFHTNIWFTAYPLISLFSFCFTRRLDDSIMWRLSNFLDSPYNALSTRYSFRYKPHRNVHTSVTGVSSASFFGEYSWQ